MSYFRDKRIAISTNKQLVERLELRLYLIGFNSSSKTFYEKNEDEILKIRTIGQIIRLKDAISTMEDEFVVLFKHSCIETLETK